jgi:hypothetical protein
MRFAIEDGAPVEAIAAQLSFVGDSADPDFRQRAMTHDSELSFKCTQIDPATGVVELLVPPQQRFD